MSVMKKRFKLNVSNMNHHVHTLLFMRADFAASL